MHPILFAIPLPFSDKKVLVYAVYVSIMLALALSIYLGTQSAKKDGLSKEIALNMTFWGLIGLIMGTRIYSVFENPSFYFSNHLRLLKLWEGSLTTYGGAVGGVIGCVGYLKLKKQPILRFLDVFIPYGFLGLGIIRMGDFLNGTAFGKETDLPWGISFPKGSFPYNYQVHHGSIWYDAPKSLPVHPTQLYSAIVCFMLFIILHLSASKTRMPPGNRFLAGAIIYAAVRIVIDHFRADLEKNLLWSLASTQWVGVAVIFLIISTWIYIGRRRLQKRQADRGRTALTN